MQIGGRPVTTISGIGQGDTLHGECEEFVPGTLERCDTQGRRHEILTGGKDSVTKNSYPQILVSPRISATYFLMLENVKF